MKSKLSWIFSAFKESYCSGVYCRDCERAPDYTHVGGEHSAEATGSKISERRPPADPLQGHFWSVRRARTTTSLIITTEVQPVTRLIKKEMKHDRAVILQYWFLTASLQACSSPYTTAFSQQLKEKRLQRSPWF